MMPGADLFLVIRSFAVTTSHAWFNRNQSHTAYTSKFDMQLNSENVQYCTIKLKLFQEL